MNKKLLTAVIGVSLSGASMLSSTAQADVKLYGKAHVSIDYLDAKASTQPHSNKATTVSSNATRWGIDVSEKLGGGLTAIVRLEQDLAADGDTNSQNARNRYVGVSGGFGTVMAGTLDTPFKAISRDVELFPEYIGDSRNILAGSRSSIAWDVRPPNAIAYVSPTFGGLALTYAYSADSTAATGTEDNRRRADSIGLKYARGPLYVNLGYESHRYNTVADGGTPAETAWRLGASYNFGAFMLVGLYQDAKDLSGTRPGDSSAKQKIWGAGGAYTAGNNIFKAQYFKAERLSDFTFSGSAVSGDGTGARMWALGWDHLFSRTTRGYLAYARTDNESAETLSVNGPTAGVHGDAVLPAAGQDPQAWSIGMIVDF